MLLFISPIVPYSTWIGHIFYQMIICFRNGIQPLCPTIIFTKRARVFSKPIAWNDSWGVKCQQRTALNKGVCVRGMCLEVCVWRYVWERRFLSHISHANNKLPRFYLQYSKFIDSLTTFSIYFYSQAISIFTWLNAPMIQWSTSSDPPPPYTPPSHKPLHIPESDSQSNSPG